MKQVDILTWFAENSMLFYLQTINQWRVKCDFRKALKDLEAGEDILLPPGKPQKRLIMIKDRVGEFKVKMEPTKVYVAKFVRKPQDNQDDDSSFDEEEPELKIKSITPSVEVISDILESDFKDWELKLLKWSKVDTSHLLIDF
jgi:hypothetical protein